MRRLLTAAACLGALAAQAQPVSVPAACGQFLGSWSGTWSQGFCGRQWIHVLDVSADCIAQVAYNPTGPDVPPQRHAMPVRDGAIEFACNAGTGGTCRLEIVGGELKTRYSDPSGFVNEGTFRKLP